MPYHIKSLRDDPVRSIVWLVAIATFVLQVLVLTPWVSPNFLQVLPNVAMVMAVCVWNIWATWKNDIKWMPRASFWLFFFWVFSGLSRLAFSPDPALLLWGPFLVVALAVGVCFVHQSGESKRRGAQ